MSFSAPTDPSALAGGRPPVEFRLLGLDRRTFRLPLLVVALFLLWAVVIPAIDHAVDYDDPVRAGDALVIGSSTTIAPPVGWGIQAGVRAGDPVRSDASSQASIAVVGDGISLSSQTGPFDGDARAFVAQIASNDEKLGAGSSFTVEGRPRTITVDGRRGVAQEFKTLTSEGAVFGFVEKGAGIAVVIAGTEDALDHASTTLGTTIASIDFDAGAQR